MANNKNTISKNKQILIIAIIVIIVLTILIILLNSNNKEAFAGEVVDGKVVYVEKILSTTKNTSGGIIEVATTHTLLDSIIITREMYEKMEQKDAKYLMSLKDILKEEETSNKELYNIKKAIELGYVAQTNSYLEFISKVTGFNDTDTFIEFCNNAFNLLDKE